MTEELFQVRGRALRLYDWQEEAVQALRDNIDAGVKNQILAAPTGSGKTICATHLISRCYQKGQRAIFVCDRIPLIEQTSRTFDEYGIPHGVIQADHWRTDPMRRIQVASSQTLARRRWPDVNLIVVDEAHTVHQTVAHRIGRRDVVTVGLTATPFPKGLGRLYDAVVNVRTLNQLTAEGYLAPFDAYAPAEPDMTDAKVTAGEWSDAEAERKALPIIGDAVAEYVEKAMGKKFLAFGVTIKHCEELQRRFMAAGVQCALYTANTPEEERKQIDRDFRQPGGYLSGLITVAALSKGYDAPSVECLIICRPLRSSFAEHIQIIGRGLRRDPANPDKRCIILDLSGNMLRFWRRMHDFFEHGASELDDGKRQQKKPTEPTEPEPMKCPKCASVHRPLPMCPACGHEYPKRDRIHHLPGKLVALGSIVPASEGDLREDVFAQLMFHAKAKGYRPGWAAHKFEELFGPGSFDPMLWRIPTRPPTEKTQDWILSRQIQWAKSKRRRKAVAR